MQDKDGNEICDRLLRAGVPVGPIRNTADVMEHEHTKHRGMAVELDWYKSWGIPVKLSRTPGSVKSVPPKFGEHGRAILAEHGFSEAEIQALADQEVLVETRRKGK